MHTKKALYTVVNSNTTLVKVKSKTYTCYYLPSIYSNTTLVKVKSTDENKINMLIDNSNTTLVKVKLV